MQFTTARIGEIKLQLAHKRPAAFNQLANFRGPREILARTSRIRGLIESIPRGIEE